MGWEGFARRRRENFGSHIVWDGIPWSFVAAPTSKNGNGTTTSKNGNGTTCVLRGMGMGREVGMLCNDGTTWESTKIEMGWDGTVLS